MRSGAIRLNDLKPVASDHREFVLSSHGIWRLCMAFNSYTGSGISDTAVPNGNLLPKLDATVLAVYAVFGKRVNDHT